MSPARTCLAAAAALMVAAALPAAAQTSAAQKGGQKVLKAPPATNVPNASDAPEPEAGAPKAKGVSGAVPANENTPANDTGKAEAVKAAPEEEQEYIGDFTVVDPPAIERGLLGGSVLTDILALALAVILGALLGGLFGAWRAAGPARRAFERHERRIAAVEKGLNAQAKLSQPPAGTGSAPQPTRLGPYGRPLPYGLDPEGTDFSSAPAPRDDPPATPDSARRAALERNRQLDQTVEDYCRLVATKGARPRQFAELLATFPRLLSVRTEAGNIVGEPYREGDANQILVAAGDGEHFAVLPTYEYLADFSMAFSKLVMTPPIVGQLFHLKEDESGQLQLVRPATVEKDESSVLRVTGKGELSGFRS